MGKTYTTPTSVSCMCATNVLCACCIMETGSCVPAVELVQQCSDAKHDMFMFRREQVPSPTIILDTASRSGMDRRVGSEMQRCSETHSLMPYPTHHGSKKKGGTRIFLVVDM